MATKNYPKITNHNSQYSKKLQLDLCRNSTWNISLVCVRYIFPLLLINCTLTLFAIGILSITPNTLDLSENDSRIYALTESDVTRLANLHTLNFCKWRDNSRTIRKLRVFKILQSDTFGKCCLTVKNQFGDAHASMIPHINTNKVSR